MQPSSSDESLVEETDFFDQVDQNQSYEINMEDENGIFNKNDSDEINQFEPIVPQNKGKSSIFDSLFTTNNQQADLPETKNNLVQ